MEWGMHWPGGDVARRAEQAGFRAFCSGEFADHEAYLTVAEMLEHVESALVGTSIAYAFARSPFVHAAAARHLARRAPGRLFLGLGSGTRRMNEQWFSVSASSPAARMAELVQCVRSYLCAENWSPVRFDGRFYHLDAEIGAPVLGPVEVPILLGAFNEGMLEVAGEHADGILGHPLFTDRWWEEVVHPALARGAAKAGRGLGELRRWGWLITAVDDEDPATATADARRMVAFYLTVRTYGGLVRLEGWEDEVAAVREAFERRDLEAMAQAVPDRVLDAVAVCGTTVEALERLRARRVRPDLAIASAPSFVVPHHRRQRYATGAIELARRFGAAPGAAGEPPSPGDGPAG
jgi:5,10-methylenetetrahydromethanopterin reductase